MTKISEPTNDQKSRSGGSFSLFREAKNREQFWWWFAAILFASSALAFLGARFGSDLATMGQLLGGTLGVAVAFAGAYAAYKIASFASRTLVLQERREASRTANETLEQSIGKILDVQLQFEALLRSVHVYTLVRDREDVSSTSDEQHSEQLSKARASIERAAGELSRGVQRVLTNPLAISVLFALQEAKPPQQRASRKQLLEDLSQLPRTADFLKTSLQRVPGRNQISTSPYGMLERMSEAAQRLIHRGESFRRLALELGYLASLHRDVIPTLSLLDGLASSYADDSFQDFHEPFLVLVSRYFVYTDKEALQALENLFSDKVYQDPEARDIILQSRPAEAFRSSGQINDKLMRSILDASARSHTKLAALSDEATGNNVASERAEAIRRLVLQSVWGDHLSHDPQLLDDLANESQELTAFQIYRIILKQRAYSRAAAGAAEQAEIIRDELRWMSSALRLRDKLENIEVHYGQPECEQAIRNTARTAQHAGVLGQMDIMPLSAVDLRGATEDSDELFEKLLHWLNRGIAENLLSEEVPELKAAVVKEFDTSPVFPRMVKLLSLAVKRCRREHGSSAKPSQLIARAWDTINGPLGPDKLVIVCEFFGLLAKVQGKVIELEDPATKIHACATVADPATLELEFRLPPLTPDPAARRELVPSFAALAIDDWSGVQDASGCRFAKCYDASSLDEVLLPAWRDLINYRRFVTVASKQGIDHLPESEANILFLAQLVELGATTAGLHVSREYNVLRLTRPHSVVHLKVVVGPHEDHIASVQASFRLGPFARDVNLTNLEQELRSKNFLTQKELGEGTQTLLVGIISELHADSSRQLGHFFRIADDIHRQVCGEQDTDTL